MDEQTRLRRRRGSRRRAVAIAGALSASLVLAACSGGSSENESGADSEAPETTSATESAPDANAESEPVTPNGKIVIWEHANEANQAYFEEKYAEYEAANPGVDIEVLYVPIADLPTKLEAAYGAGNPPDIVKVGAWLMTGYVDRGYLSPVDSSAMGKGSLEELFAEFEEGAFAPVTFGGTAYGVPTDFNSVSLWYRKDRFEEAGLDPNSPPTTWEEVLEMSAKLTNADASQVGLQWTLAGDPIWAQLCFLPLVEGLGGSLLNADNTAGNLNTPEGIRALQYYSEVGNPNLTAPIGGFSMFAEGTAAMLMGGRFMSGFMPSLNDSLVYGENFATTTVPVWAGDSPVAAGYSWAWGVSAASQNQATAWNLIGWLNTPENAEAQLAATGLVTPLVGWTSTEPGSDEASVVMQEQLPYTTYGPQTAQWTEVMTALSETLDAVSLKQQTPEEAAAAFDSKVAGILG